MLWHELIAVCWQVAAFISEPLMTGGGVIVYPPKYLKLVYRYGEQNIVSINDVAWYLLLE